MSAFGQMASCQRDAHKHQRSPGFKPGKPSSGIGVGDLEKLEERGNHHGADRVATNVLLSSIAAPVPIKPRHGGYGANIERLTKHVAGSTAPTASIATVVPQHRRLLLT